MEDHVEGVGGFDVAVRILQNMINRKLICHASGNQDFPFLGGHHLYFIVQPGTGKKSFFYNLHDEIVIKMGQPRPLFSLFLVFSNKHHYNFYNKYVWKNVHPVYCTGIRTHDLQNMSLFP